ncbi:MAG: glutamine--tRNA ligase/YqeY domain fusion protein [Proteobacteria bacterium]|jgi:glutaminyl-tRNA synthetase|nr:glutamine--tRNA ligase/YqeY domain fusion protein [Pseudomonadota bacterium]
MSKPLKPSSPSAPPPAPSNFIRSIIEEDQRSGRHGGQVTTRFPPEPNGYLHIGHAKSICLNFGIARDFGGRCHMRFDDTNPAKEETEYVESIMASVRWMGFDWGEHLHFASDYFQQLYDYAELLVTRGEAYVDSLSADEIRACRGTLTEPGRDSPYRTRTPEENLELLRRMKAGEFPDGAHVLRLKLDMRSPNINLRDPLIYRIRHQTHHRTGDTWCIYPLYDYTHALSDAIEHITHSICTLEFEDHRPLYDWCVENLPVPYRPYQYEFARLNLTYAVLSKRRLIDLVESGCVDGWDDPRLPTLVGVRRRGYTPEGMQLFCERIGVSKAESWIDMGVLEQAIRDDLEPKAPRAIAVLSPLRLVIDNFPEGRIEPCSAPVHPHHPEMGRREFPLTRELWIERDDFEETPPKGYFRLSPGAEVRLRYGYVVRCTGFDKDASGAVVAVHCEYLPETKSGTPGADSRKVKGNIHWVSCAHALAAEVRLYDRLFAVPHPGTGERDYKLDLNPSSKTVITAQCEPGLAGAVPEQRFQFERHGYFVADRLDSRPGVPVFNRAVTLKDSWAPRG